MLKARKSKWFEWVFAVYSRNLFRRRFSALRIDGIQRLPKASSLILSNHSGWWDGLVGFEISRAAGLNSFYMMEERQLVDLPLFLKLGAFSIVRENARQALESINYAAGLLREPDDRSVWMFPQGEIKPNDVRPLGFFSGALKVYRKAGEVSVVPIAMRYEFFGDWKPEILVKVGDPIVAPELEPMSDRAAAENLDLCVSRLLDEIGRDIITGRMDHYENIL